MLLKHITDNSILSIYSFLIKYSFLGEVNIMIDKKVVLITDKNEKINHADISNRNLEGNNAISTKTISEAIMSISKEFELITDVSKFLNSIYDYKDDIIFPMKYGHNSPDSKSILPGICEGGHLKYVGGDDYAHIICYINILQNYLHESSVLKQHLAFYLENLLILIQLMKHYMF